MPPVIGGLRPTPRSLAAGCTRTGDRSARPTDRRAAVQASRRGARTGVLRPCTAVRAGPGGGGDRLGAGLPASRERGCAGGTACQRVLRKQCHRNRSRPTQGEAAADARGSHALHRRGPFLPGTPLCRTCAAATTRSPATCPFRIGSGPRSKSPPCSSDSRELPEHSNTGAPCVQSCNTPGRPGHDVASPCGRVCPAWTRRLRTGLLRGRV